MSLDGIGVVVTRVDDELAARLASLGADVSVVALTAVTPDADGGRAVAAAVADAANYDWLVLSSVNGVDAVAAQVDGELPASLRLAAVGTATAAAAERRLGRRPDLVPSDQRAAGLVAELTAALAGDRARRLVVQGEAAAPTLVTGLRAVGHEVRAEIGYRMRRITLSAAERCQLDAATIVVVASGSACEALVVVDPTAIDRPSLTLVAIGPTTAAAAASAGFARVVTAASPSTADLVAAVVVAAR